MKLSSEQRQRIAAVMTAAVQAVAQWLADIATAIRRTWKTMVPLFAALRAAQAHRPVWAVSRLDGR